MNVSNHSYWAITNAADHAYTTFFVVHYDCACKFRLYAFHFNSGTLPKRYIKQFLSNVCLDHLTLLLEAVTKTNYQGNFFRFPILYFNFASNNWPSTKFLGYFFSTIFSTTTWINEGAVTVWRSWCNIFVSETNALFSDRLLPAILSSAWCNFFMNEVKSMEKKLLQVFVHYIIQTSNLSEFFTSIKDIIIGKVGETL